MFEQFSKFHHILVTGPQRAGTTICAKMISQDTGLRFLPEGAMATGNKADEMYSSLRRLVEKHDNIVVQCPIQCRYIHKFSSEDTLIVMMLRPIDEIQASERRIGWGDAYQRVLYNDVIKYYNIPEDKPIAAVKYEYWRRFQRPQIVHWHEQSYEELAQHPLWIPKERRVGFGPRQIGANNSFRSEIFIKPLV